MFFCIEIGESIALTSCKVYITKVILVRITLSYTGFWGFLVTWMHEGGGKVGEAESDGSSNTI